MDVRFNGKRALVTGAGQGIGRDIAKALAHGGAEVFAVSRTAARLETLKQEVPSINTVTVDLTDWAATRKAIQELGHIDLLVNNAGMGQNTPFLDISAEEFDNIININLKAVLNVTQVVIGGMVEKGGGGAIVNISSQASMSALDGHAVYCASKGALDQMTRVMALEFGPHQIRVNCVNPTVVMTEMAKQHWGAPEKKGPMLAKIPLGRFAEVADVVNSVLFLLSDKAGMITGSMLPIDGGFLAC